MSKWIESRVVENRHWTDALFSLRVEAPRVGFEAGQFVRIALESVDCRAVDCRHMFDHSLGHFFRLLLFPLNIPHHRSL